MKKKIIFWVDGNLSTFCILKKIQEDIDCEMHAIFNVTNKPKKFIQNQKLIDFKSFSFYHDNVTDLNSEPDLNYLKQKEEEYKVLRSEFHKDKGTIDTFSPEELKELERLNKVQESINWDKLRQEKEYLKLMADSRKYNKLKKYSVIWFFIIFFRSNGNN